MTHRSWFKPMSALAILALLALALQQIGWLPALAQTPALTPPDEAAAAPAASPVSVFTAGEVTNSTPLNVEIIVVRAYYDDERMVNALAAWLEPWEVKRDKGYLVVGVSPEQYDLLELLGFRLEVDEEMTIAANQALTPLPGQVNGIPGYACYRTVEETYATAEAIVAEHPELATWLDIGDSWKKTVNQGGYDLMVLRLTNSNVGGSKPIIFVMSAVHAREYTTAELMTRFAEYLVDNYGVNADVTWLLDYHEFHLLLQANPDGRKQAESGISWRKNTNNNYCANTSSRGVDLNRNFEFYWGCCGGSSGSQCDDTYRGPTAASEPETQAVQNYVRSIFSDQRGPGLSDPAPANATGVFLDIHSYSQLVLWPWGFTSNQSPNGTGLTTLGRRLAFFNGYSPSQSIELYPVDGSTIDFAYGDLGLAGYTFELGTAFFESCSTFEQTILPDNLPALIYAAKAARAPYQLPGGPESVNLALSSNPVAAGQITTLSATVDDTRTNTSNGSDPTHNINAAEYYIDLPPWETSAVAHPMTAADGSFNAKTEVVQASIDTSDLSSGKHIIYVRGRDVSGTWGPVTAIFIYVIDPTTAPVLTGQVVAGDTNQPLPATITVNELLSGESNPETGFYEMYTFSGPLSVKVTPQSSSYASIEATGLVIEDGQVLIQDFVLNPICSAYNFDAESGSTGWTIQSPWAISTEMSHSPTHAWSDSPSANYSNSRNVAITSPVINLTGYSGVEVNFWHVCNTEAGYDFCRVEISDNGGSSWTQLATFDGAMTGWEEVSLMAPQLDNQPDARLRFRLTTDGGLTADGWHVDDIRLLGSSAGCLTLQAPLADFQSNSPVLLGETSVFTDTSAGSFLAFTWDFGDGSPISTLRNPSHTYAAGGVYTVTLTASNELGSDSAEVPVQILAPTSSLSKVASSAEVEAGTTLTYTLTHTLALAGTHVYTQSLTDFLPASVSLLTETLELNGVPAPGLYDPLTHRINLVSDGMLTDQAVFTLTYAVRVDSEVISGTLLTNSVLTYALVHELVATGETSHTVTVIEVVEPPVLKPLFLPFMAGEGATPLVRRR